MHGTTTDNNEKHVNLPNYQQSQATQWLITNK